MEFFRELLVGLLTAYLAVTNSLADTLLTWFNPTSPSETTAVTLTQETEDTEPNLTSLPSRTSIIPDILLRSAAYQQASVIQGTSLTGATAATIDEALVNILCTFTTEDTIRTTTGTGFFIDPDGVIITNAHVAQYLLLTESADFVESECIIRTGNPAAPRYTAELLYLPPAWIFENASTMYDAVPMGTGERDYALLHVRETTTGEPLPAVFPALGYNTRELTLGTVNDTVVAGGYPAGELIREGASAVLVPEVASSSISELYTFGSNLADVFSIRGTQVGAEGASGGPVVNARGEVIGLIVTRGDDATDGVGSLRAITLSYINRTITEETGFSLERNINGPVAERARIFRATVSPFLVELLEQSAPTAGE